MQNSLIAQTTESDNPSAMNPKQPRHISAVVWILVLPLILAANIWISISLVKSQGGYVESDFYVLWAGGRALVEGKDPYDPDDWLAVRSELPGTWLANPASLYPLPTNILFMPLGRLPINIAAGLWIFLVQVMILSSLYFCFRAASFGRWSVYLLPIIPAIVLFRPTILTVRNGHMGGFLLLMLSLAIWLWGHQRWLLGGMVIGLLVMKPTIAAPFLLLCGIWMLLKKHWSAILGMGAMTFGWMAISFIMDRNWMEGWLCSGAGKIEQDAAYVPTIWGVSARLFGPEGGWQIWAILLTLLLLAFGVFIIWTSKAEDEMHALAGFLIPISLLVTPYLWNYDHILLINSMIFIVANLDRKGIPFLLNASLFLFLDIFALVLLFLAFSLKHDVLSVLIPVGVIWAALASKWLPSRNEEEKLSNRLARSNIA